MYIISRRTLHLVLILVLGTTPIAAYTLQNVTVGSQDPDITYYPPCGSRKQNDCQGAWYQASDPRFYNGTAMVCSEPTVNFSNIEDYFVYTFKGSAMYMYQWMNSSVASQTRLFNNGPNPFLSLKQEYAGKLTGELVPVMTWALTGLDPLKEHTLGVQHFTDTASGTKSYMIFDYMIVTKTILDPGELNHKKGPSTGTIVGGVLGAIFAVLALVLGCCIFRRRMRQRGGREKEHRYAWEGNAVPTPATLKFVDPSSEIEQSERIAREGRIEETKEPTSPRSPPKSPSTRNSVLSAPKDDVPPWEKISLKVM